MKIFAIKDETDTSAKTLAWLLYYEQPKKFYIELPDNADPWETPLLLSTFAKRGEHTVNSYWSKMWVQERIVPYDRQNIGQILKANGLNEYDEFQLLMLANGRCAQDNNYLEPVNPKEFPPELKKRFLRKAEDVIPLPENNLLVFFRNGEIRKCDINSFFKENPMFAPISSDETVFCSVFVEPGGNGISWGEGLNISSDLLYSSGKKIPLPAEAFQSFVRYRTVSSAEASKMLNCSRQNIEDLVRRGKLHPVKTSPKNKLFLKKEIEERANGGFTDCTFYKAHNPDL